jgi:hypothetical protein
VAAAGRLRPSADRASAGRFISPQDGTGRPDRGAVHRRLAARRRVAGPGRGWRASDLGARAGAAEDIAVRRQRHRAS